MAAEVSPRHIRMVHQLSGRPLEHHLALLQYVGAVGDAQRKIGHLLYEQDRAAGTAEVLDDLENLPHQERGLLVKKARKKKKVVDLGDVFLGLQREMVAALRGARRNVQHPTAKGNISENSWRNLLKTYLPERYRVAEAFVVDSKGNISDQLDLVIFDRQYSPFLFYVEGACYIPAESVYAVFEIKQTAKQETA